MGSFTKKGLQVLKRRESALVGGHRTAERRYRRSHETDQDARLDMRRANLDLDRLKEWQTLLERRLQRG